MPDQPWILIVRSGQTSIHPAILHTLAEGSIWFVHRTEFHAIKNVSIVLHIIQT